MIQIVLLPSYIDDIGCMMAARGYSVQSIGQMKCRLNKMLKYFVCAEKDFISIEDMNQYLYQYQIYDFKPKNRKERSFTRPILMLIDYFYNHKIETAYCSIPISTYVFPKMLCNLLEEYKTYVMSLNLSISMKKRKINVLSEFFKYISSNEITIKSLDKKTCYTFISVFSNNLALTTKNEKIYRFRDALNWLYDRNILSFSGFDLIPQLKNYHDTNLKTYYTKEEIIKLLSSIDISTSVGKTYYAMTTLFIYYGLRKSDVLNLKLSSIDWNKNSLSIVQQKTKELLILPLISEVKYALLNYIRDVRISNCVDKDYVFIRTIRPYTKYSTADFNHVFKDYVSKSKITTNNKNYGCHIFRFSIVNNMLNNDVQISVIGNVLGHKSLDSTNSYLSIDTRKLKKLSLEVPNVQR